MRRKRELEKPIERRILSFLADVGIWAVKIETVGIFNPQRGRFLPLRGDHSARGMPDIIGILAAGRFLGIEVKSKAGRPTPDQLDKIRTIQDNGGVAFISRSVAQTYNQLLPFYPELAKFMHVLNKYEQIEREN